MSNPPVTAPVTTRSHGRWPVVGAVLVGIWAVLVTLGGQAVGWLVGQVLLVTGLSQPTWLWPVTGALNALLVGVPAGLLAALPRSPAVRASGRAWLLGAITLGAGSLLRAVPMPLHEFYLAGLALVATGLAVAVRRWGRAAPGPAAPGRASAERGASGRSTVVPLAVAGGLALLLPWLWLGAPGGGLETGLALIAAAAVGWLGATILDRGFWAAYRRRRDGRPIGVPTRVLLGALVAGVALLLLGAGVGQAGAQLAALLVLPVTGPLAAALLTVAVRDRVEAGVPDPAPDAAGAGTGPAGTVGVLVGFAACGPLALVDPEEISVLLLEGRETAFWAGLAIAVSLAVGLVLLIGYAVTFTRTRGRAPGRRVALVTAAAMLFAAVAVQLGPGQPGLHGERLFVVLRTQADLSGIAGPTGSAGRDARAREVYRRLVATAERSQAGLRRQLDRWRRSYTSYYLVNAVEVEAGPAVRAWLSRRGDVDRVLLSQRLRPLPAQPELTGGKSGAAPGEGPAWNLDLIGAGRVRAQLGVDGSGIVVGGSDSGVDGRHPALAGGFRGGDDSWYDPWRGTRSPTDLGWHGTHTLATAVGGAGVGVAPGARWVGCVNLGRNLGNPARYLDCLQFMLAPFPPGGDPFTDGRPERAPHVLSNSWGCPPIEGCDSRSLRPATAALAAAGVLVVVSAGNTGPFCGSVDDPPAPYADVLTVGAVDRTRRVTSFSSRGPVAAGAGKPDLVAPGAGVRSAVPDGGYATHDGTSMAAPHVAGVVALMWSANPMLIGDLELTRRILSETVGEAVPSYRSSAPADQCGGPANVTGAGLVDAYAAVRAAQRAAGGGG